MKKSILFLWTLCAVMFISCSKDDESTSNGNKPDENLTTNYVPINWDETTLEESNPQTGTFTFAFSDTVPTLRLGSVIAVDADTAGYIAIVKKITRNGNKITVETDPGSLCDIFADTNFTLSTSGQSSQAPYTRAAGNVYYPAEILYRDLDGTLKKIEREVGTRATTTLTGDLWNWGENFNGTVLFSGDNYKVYMKESTYSLDIDLDVTLNFGGRSLLESTADAYSLYRSKALSIDASIYGEATTRQLLQLDAWGRCHYQEEEDDLWKHNIFKPVRIKFMVGAVPIFVTLCADLFRGASFDAEGEISAYTGFSDVAEGRLGVQWNQSGGISPVSHFSNTYTYTPPTIEGRGKIEAKAWLYPRVRVILYDLAGPSFDIKPYLKTKIEGGFKATQSGALSDYSAWSLTNYAGLDVAAGLSLMFMNYETENYSTPNVNVIEKPLYQSPYRIKLLSSTSREVAKGVKNNVSFEVYDNNILFGKEVLTPLPQIVKFQASGSLSSQYGIVKDGIAKVDWVPSSSSDTLYARLYNMDGSVMSEAKFYGDEPVAITGNSDAVTFNSAKITCSYKRVPSDAQCGVSVTSSSGTSSLPASIQESEGSYTFLLENLQPQITYTYQAYILYQGKSYYGDKKSFTTLKKNDDVVTPGTVIDLGLSVKWASYNVGASSPEDYGGYYAWGETEEKSDYDWSTYIHCDGSYSTCHNIGSTICGTQYDVAHVKWGGQWRMPTHDELNELKDKCTWTWTTLNGVKGMKVTGPNGNSIFLPAAGLRNGNGVDSTGSYGDYWSGSLYESYEDHAWGLYFGNDGGSHWYYGGRYLGFQVRPVSE